MMTAGVSNLGLDTVGMLLYVHSGSPIVGLGTRESSKGLLGRGVGAVGRGERCSRRVTDERLKSGVSLVQRWTRRRRAFDAATFRAKAAEDVEKEEVVSDKEEEEEEEEVASSSERLHQLSSRETPKISRIERQQGQRSRDRKQAGPRNPGLFSNLVEEWASREKGDVRDVVLMSLSFAVLIYISQHLVHAYCTLRHMYFSHY